MYAFRGVNDTAIIDISYRYIDIFDVNFNFDTSSIYRIKNDQKILSDFFEY
jgi:hypothetical protein